MQEECLETEHLRAGAHSPGCPSLLFLCSSLHPLSRLEGQHGPGHPDPGFRFARLSTAKQPLSRSTSLQEDTLPRVPGQKRYTSRRPPRTIWQGIWIIAAQNVRNSIRNSVSLLSPMLLGMPRRLGHQQGGPGLQAPGQAGHDHVGPVADQVVHRGCQGVHAALELGDQVLLVAPAVRRRARPLRPSARGHW